MADLILHHYDFSPFSEKIRLAFGHKGLAWRSVQTPLAAPKPDLVPLTAGYRRAPVMQVGADVYCDTKLILREIERRHPDRSLYPGGTAALCDALAWWWERTTFLTAASMATSVIGDGIPADFIEERKLLMGRDFTKSASLAILPANTQRMHAHMAWLAEMLGGKPYLLADALSAADLAAYHTLWFARQNGGADVEAMLPLAPFQAWMRRIAAIGHGERQEMAAEEALAVAKACEPEPVANKPDGDPSGLRPGQTVAVTTDDMNHDPVRGTLVAADDAVIILRHSDDRVGTVHIHFPRAGYDVKGEGR